MSEGQSAVLTVLGGAGAGQRHPLPAGGDVVIGSHPSCAIVIPVFGVSPQHAVLRVGLEGVSVHDLGTPAGVFVNDNRVAGEQPLIAGDVLWLGAPGGQGSVGLQFSLEQGRREGGDFFVSEETIATGAPRAAAAPSGAEDEIFFVGEPGAGAAPPAASAVVEPEEVVEDAFFVGDAAGAPPSAPAAAPPTATPPPAPTEDAFFVGETMAAPAPQPPVGPPSSDSAFFVADSPTVAQPPPAPVAAPAKDEFFVQEAAPARPQAAPAAAAPVGGVEDEFFVGEAPPGPAAAPAPRPSAPPRPPAAPPPTPPKAPAAPPAAAPAAAGAAPTARSGSPAARPATAPRPGPGAAPPQPPTGRPPVPATGAKRPPSRPVMRPGVPPVRPGAGPRTGSASARPGARPATTRTPYPRKRSSGLPGFVLPLVLLVAVVGGVGGAVYALMIAGRPVIHSIEPTRTKVGDVVVLTGERFATPAGGNTVLFGKAEAEVLSGDATRLEVRVPDAGVAPGQEAPLAVKVRVGRKRSAALEVNVRQPPRIHGLSPDVARPGEQIMISGAGWGAVGVQVLMGDVAVEPSEITPTYLWARVPAMPEGRVVGVVVVEGQDRSAPAELVVGRLPALASIEPAEAVAGNVVTFSGRGFRGAPADYRVTIGGAPALVSRTAEGQVQAVVPLAAGVGAQPVEILVQGHSSPATGTLRVGAFPDPVGFRFVAEPFGDLPGRAAVTSGIGTMFVLADAGGRSAAERAFAAMGALNAAAEAIKAAQTVAIQARPGGTGTELVLSGTDAVLLEVTDEDAVALAADAGSGRGPALTRDRLAVWWAAILGDLALMLGRNEAPGYAVSLAPAGAVLQEVQRASAASGAPGLSRARILGALPSVRESLSLLARRVPATVRAP